MPGQRRVAVEARWWKSLWPLLEQERQSVDELRGVGVHLRFKQGLPDRCDHQALARELVRVVQVAASRGDIEVVFMSRVDVDQANRLVQGFYFLPEEDWPLTSGCLSLLRVSRWPVNAWLTWNCMEVAAAWLGPDEDEFKRILEDKRKKARGYNLAGTPLWLLVVCETQGDLESHIFPRDDRDLAALEAKVRESGFDFASSPFAEVWLLSAFNGRQRRLYPPHGE